MSGTPRSASISGIRPKPIQLDPTPSDHAVRIMFWTARLPSETAMRLSFTIVTAIASAAPAA